MAKADAGRRAKARATRLVGALVAAMSLAPATSMSAGAQQDATPFVPASSSVTWQAMPSGGSPISSNVTIDTAVLATGAELHAAAPLASDRTYLYVALHASYAFSVDPTTPLPMPPTSATLLTSDGSETGIPVPQMSLGIDDGWYFPVASTLTSATLNVAPFTKILGNDRGDFLTWTFTPTPIAFVAMPLPGGERPRSASQSAAGATAEPMATTPARGSGTPLGTWLAAGGVALLAAVGAGVVAVRRRRAFARADREGRIVLAGPSTFLAGVTPAGEVVAPERGGVVVKLLGPLELDGVRHPVTAGPLLELIVFLVLHPGRSFTSVQLRESIWGLSRQPITSNTFRKYMVQLRRAFGPGVVVTDVYRYELTNAVTSDWDRFQAALTTEDVRAGQDEALDLVRGPVLHGCFDGRKNAPFSWAADTVDAIEDEVTDVAFRLAIASLDLDDPRRAAEAVSRGLLCSAASLRLRTLDLRVAVALGGPGELNRRLENGRIAMATFPTDVAQLEEAARTLGWVSAAPE